MSLTKPPGREGEREGEGGGGGGGEMERGRGMGGEGEGEGAGEGGRERDYAQVSVELGPEDVSLLKKCPISEGVMYRLQWSWDLKMCPY